MKTLTQEEVFQQDDIHIFTYDVNTLALKILDFGAIFLLLMAALVHPFTNFDPKAWIIVPILCAIVAVTALMTAQYWRKFARNAILAYDDTYFYVGKDTQKVHCIPWSKLTLHNSGLAEAGKGANFVIRIEGTKVPVCLFNTLVIVPQFETVLRTILKHIQTNEKQIESQATAQDNNAAQK